MLADTDLKVVALCISDEGMPQTGNQRIQIADKLITCLINKGVRLENIFVDPVVQPISASPKFLEVSA